MAPGENEFHTPAIDPGEVVRLMSFLQTVQGPKGTSTWPDMFPLLTVLAVIFSGLLCWTAQR